MSDDLKLRRLRYQGQLSSFTEADRATNEAVKKAAKALGITPAEYVAEAIRLRFYAEKLG